jgi:hypothetical protein
MSTVTSSWMLKHPCSTSRSPSAIGRVLCDPAVLFCQSAGQVVLSDQLVGEQIVVEAPAVCGLCADFPQPDRRLRRDGQDAQVGLEHDPNPRKVGGLEREVWGAHVTGSGQGHRASTWWMTRSERAPTTVPSVRSGRYGQWSSFPVVVKCQCKRGLLCQHAHVRSAGDVHPP